MEENEMNILHLSDIHFGRNYKCYGLNDKFDDKEKILEELIQCIKELDEFCPEHIVVTGDIAWHGKREEYEEAQKWFERLLWATNLTGKDITFCVGNHDVNRSYANTHIDYTDDSIKEIDEIYDYENIHELEAPIYEYDRFCEKMGMEPYAYPCNGKTEYSYSIGYKDVEFQSKNKIRLVAFNTALLSFASSSSISQDKMWIGQKQVLKLIEYGIFPNDDIHYTIALFHHAERFLHPNEICEYDDRVSTLNLLRKNVDLILCGHTETGGKPVLQQQVGGGMLLTAGAAYYNDTHPNAFSILCVPDNAKTVLINPFTYQDGWKKYDLKEKEVSIKKLYELSALGDMKEKCNFVVETEKEKYEIPLKKVTVYQYEKDGKPYVEIDNRKEVLRYLDIRCAGPAAGGQMDVSVELAPKMSCSVRAMLKRDEYFNFLSKNISDGNKMKFYVESASGVKFISGENLNVKVEEDKLSVFYLEKLKRIEDYYGIRFYRPDDLYEQDAERLCILVELIEKGYTKKFQLGKLVTTSFSDYEKLKLFYEQALKVNSFCLVYEDDFLCNFYDVQFSMGKIMLVAGMYQIDLDDVKCKLKTFAQGDSRQITFTAKDSFQTYFVVDKEKARNEVTMPADGEIFTVDKMKLNWDFIYNV